MFSDGYEPACLTVPATANSSSHRPHHWHPNEISQFQCQHLQRSIEANLFPPLHSSQHLKYSHAASPSPGCFSLSFSREKVDSIEWTRTEVKEYNGLLEAGKKRGRIVESGTGVGVGVGVGVGAGAGAGAGEEGVGVGKGEKVLPRRPDSEGRQHNADNDTQPQTKAEKVHSKCPQNARKSPTYLLLSSVFLTLRTQFSVHVVSLPFS